MCHSWQVKPGKWKHRRRRRLFSWRGCDNRQKKRATVIGQGHVSRWKVLLFHSARVDRTEDRICVIGANELLRKTHTKQRREALRPLAALILIFYDEYSELSPIDEACTFVLTGIRVKFNEHILTLSLTKAEVLYVFSHWTDQTLFRPFRDTLRPDIAI